MSPRRIGAPLLSTTLASVSVTAAITLTATAFGNTHICTGTSADYTVTLPTAVGNTDKVIRLKMSSALTKFVTVACNGAQTIDGATTRVMWAKETATLVSDGANWYKIAGASYPMLCTMRLSNAGSPSNAQAIANATVVKVTLNATDLDNTGAMADPSTNNRINIKRAGNYTVTGAAYMNTASAGPRFICQIFQTGTQVYASEAAAYAASFPSPTPVNTIAWAVGDYAEMKLYQNSGGSQWAYGDPTGAACLLIAVEVPAW